MIIYVETIFPEDVKAQLVENLPTDQVIFKGDLPSSDAQQQALLSADIILGNPKPANILANSAQLKWLQLMSTGFEYYKQVTTNAIVTNLQDYYSSPCAETIIAGIMTLYRGTDTFTRLKEQKKWVGHALRPALQLLYEKKVTILGWGNIAKRIAENLSGFKCNITVYSRSSGSIHSLEALKQHLPDTDIVIGCLPGTEETRGMFTPEMIKLLKPTALFCNVGRGNLLLDELALVNALNNKAIGGAVLDVTAEEPLPTNHPLWDCPNTILTQHTGGGSNTEFEGMIKVFLENLSRYKKGEPLTNIVTLQKGY